MAISRKELLRRITEETDWQHRFIVEPLFSGSFDTDAASASLDIHLGNRFTVLRSRRSVQHDPLSSDRHHDVATNELFIPMGQDFSLHPGRVILGTTLEWFRFPGDLIAYVIGRSIWGRRGLLAVTAQAVQPGSCGTITLELCNLGEKALRLRPGAAIGQLFFHKVDVKLMSSERKSTFSGAYRPILGTYVQTDVEKMLLGL